MEMQLSMLCPACQEVRHATISCKDYQDLRLWISPKAECPSCGAPMYHADEELIPALSALNRFGIVTLYHCSNAHDGCDALRIGADRELRGVWIAGPYIILQDVDETVITSLSDDVMLKNESATDKRMRAKLEVQRVITEETIGKPIEAKHNRVTISVEVTTANPVVLAAACTMLNSIISDTAIYLAETNYHGKSRKTMSRIRRSTNIPMHDCSKEPIEVIGECPEVIIHEDI